MTESDSRPANGVTAAEMHVRITNHDLALKSRQRSSCAECDWTWPPVTDPRPADDLLTWADNHSMPDAWTQGSLAVTTVAASRIRDLAAEVRRLRDDLARERDEAEKWKARAKRRTLAYRDLLEGRTLPAEAEVRRLRAEVDRLGVERSEAAVRSIVARNPGIDEDEVRRSVTATRATPERGADRG